MKGESTMLYLITLDRFGYTLTLVTDNKEQGIKEMLRAYIRAYRKRNGTSPWHDERYDTNYYENAKEDICVIELEPNKVEWL